MKKSLFAIGIISLITVNYTFSQTSESALLSPQAIHNQPFASENEVASDDIEDAVEQRFKKQYKNIQNASWSKVNDRYRVRFIQDNITCVVDYTKKGKLYSTIRYGEELLSTKHKKIINQALSVRNILSVSEIKMTGYGDIVYVVILEDEQSVKTVQIIGEKMMVINEQAKKD